MTDPDMMPADVHPEIALLPWYANGTLCDAERQQVSRHPSPVNPVGANSTN